MDIEKLKQFIKDSKFCSETEKYAVACSTGNLAIIPWRKSLADAWVHLDNVQKDAVREYRRNAGLPSFIFESK